MNLPEFKRKKNDLLAEVLDEFLNTDSEDKFYFLMGQRLRGGKGKTYKNMDERLPLGGFYQELEVNGPQDSRRIIIDTNKYHLYATRDHYQTICDVGIPNWA
jgi:hypothetical protein